MPIATLKFKLPDEQYEFEGATNGAKWRSILYDLTEKLRKTRKHCEDQAKSEYADELLSEIFQEMNEENLTFE